MTDEPVQPPYDAVTTPAGNSTTCPQCGVSLDALTTACARCGAVITGGGADGERVERLRQRLQGQIGAAYQLGPLIGRGGMGIVFRAREVALDREVALKVLAFDALLNPDAFARFEREAKLAARLDHPNIVPIFAVGQGDGAAYYTMRFVRGGSLESLIERQGALPLADAVRLLHEVASALDFAHAQGIVHRDIKPANILLSDSGHAMVADFGIARAFAGDDAAVTSGSHTGVVGSPAYMAPEQWRGDKPDGRADQYALGVLAFELLSGQRPFRDVSMQELLRMHLGEAPPQLESVRKGMPVRVGTAIQRAMAKNPADRFPSATAFVSALAGDGAVDVPARRRQAPAAPTPPHPGSEGAGTRQWLGNAIAAVLVLTAAAVGWREWHRSAPAPAPAAVAPTAAAPQRDTLAARLERELEETRKIALDAQRRAERAESQRPEAPPAAPQEGHVAVSVRGGAPGVYVDGRELASTSPAIIDVPPGRHVIDVREQGRRYLPAQYEIDVAAGDTSHLVFTDPRLAGREWKQSAPQGQPQRSPAGQSPRFMEQRGGSGGGGTGADVPGSDTTAGARGSANPYQLQARVWNQMSAQEQAMLRARWEQMSPEQRRRALRDIQLREANGAVFPRRGQSPPPAARPPAR